MRATKESLVRELSPVFRMLDKHPDITSDKLNGPEQDYPKVASDYIMLKSHVIPNRSILKLNTTLEKLIYKMYLTFPIILKTL